MLSRSSIRASNFAINSLLRSKLQNKWSTNHFLLCFPKKMLSSVTDGSEVATISDMGVKRVVTKSEIKLEQNYSYRDKYIGLTLTDTLKASVQHHDYETFSKTLSKMKFNDFKGRPAETLIPLLSDSFIDTCDANAAFIANSLVNLRFIKGHKPNAHVLEKLFIRHNTLTREVVPPTNPDNLTQNIITHKHHARAMVSMAKAGFSRDNLVHWSGEPKVYGWLASCLQSGIDGRDLSCFLSSMATMGFKWADMPHKLCQDIVAGFIANTKVAGAMSGVEASISVRSIILLGCSTDDMKRYNSYDKFLSIVEKVIKLSSKESSGEEVASAARNIVKTLQALARWELPFLSMPASLQETVMRSVLENKDLQFDAQQMSELLLSLGRMRLFFAHITPRGQGNMYAQCERLIPVMNLDEFTNSLHGLSLSLFKVNGVPREMRDCICHRIETLFGTEEADPTHLYHLEFSQRQGQEDDFFIRNNTTSGDEANEGRRMAMLPHLIERQHLEEQERISTLLLSISSMSFKWHLLWDSTRIAIFNMIAQASCFKNSNFAAVLRGLAKMGFKWHQSNDSAKQLILKNLYNAKCFTNGKIRPVSTSIMSLSDIDMPWFLLPKETLLNYVETNAITLNTLELMNLLKGLGRLACTWQTLPVSFLQTVDRLVHKYGEKMTERDLAGTMEGIALMAFDLDPIRARRSSEGYAEARDLHEGDNKEHSKLGKTCNAQGRAHDNMGNGINSGRIETYDTRVRNVEVDYSFPQQLQLLFSICDELVRVYALKVRSGEIRGVEMDPPKEEGESSQSSEEGGESVDGEMTIEEERELLRKYNYSSRMQYINEQSARDAALAKEVAYRKKIVMHELDMGFVENFAIFFEVLSSFEGGQQIISRHFENLVTPVPRMCIVSDRIYDDNVRILALIPPLEDRLWLDSTKYRTEFNFFGLHNRILPVDCAIFKDKDLVALVHETKIAERFKKFHSLGAARVLKLKEFIYAARYPDVPYYRLGSTELDQISINSAVQRLAKVILHEEDPHVRLLPMRQRLVVDKLVRQVHIDRASDEISNREKRRQRGEPEWVKRGDRQRDEKRSN